jgi:hypothetical protein
MRIPAIILGAALIALAACGQDDREPSSSHASRSAGPAMPAPATNGTITAQVLRVDRDRDRVEARLRLENTGTDPVELRNVGDTLTGFRVVIDGSSYSAESHRRDGTLASAASIAVLPPQTPIELDLRWMVPHLRHGEDADFAIVVSNLFANSQKLPDISILVPGAHPDEEPPEPEKQPEKQKEKHQQVSL